MANRPTRNLKDDNPIRGEPARAFDDLYHSLVTASWPGLIARIALAFTIANLIFATGYYFDQGIENVHSHDFIDMFFFSVQTMATIGYGKMDPDTFLAEVMMSIEALTGLVGLAMVTGLVFAKFSRPTARVRFSRVAIVSNRDGIPSLQFRMANMRANRIVDVSATVVFARQEKTLEGEEMRRFYDLETTRSRSAMFALSWTAVHQIVEGTPLFGATRESIAAQRARAHRVDRRTRRDVLSNRSRAGIPSNSTRSSGARASPTCWCSIPTAAAASTTTTSTTSK